MMRAGWTSAIVACIMGTAGAVAAAAQATSPAASVARTAGDSARADTSRSTLSGVYTDLQAKRGEQTYAGLCASCHTPTSHTGANFTQNWLSRTLYDLYLYVSQQMPQDNPGSLDPKDAVDVVAYLLKIYAMPAGAVELAPDTVAMKKVIIDSVPKGPTP